MTLAPRPPKRALDDLQGRKDVDPARAGVPGISYGSQAMVSLLTVEPRLGPAVRIGGGVSFLPGLPVAEQPFHYYPRVRQPIPMLSGRWDIDVSLRILQRKGDQMVFRYDYGDDWEHLVVVESGTHPDDRLQYPLCIGGARACPPEDCGGVQWMRGVTPRARVAEGSGAESPNRAVVCRPTRRARRT